MTLITYPFTFADGMVADGDDLQTQFNAISTVVNAGLDSSNIDGTKELLSDTTHGNRTGTSTMHKAAAVAVVDSAGYFTGTNVETVLAEIANKTGVGASGAVSAVKFCGNDYNATTAATCQVSIPANTATNGIIVVGRATVTTTISSSRLYVPISLNGTSLSPDSAGRDPQFHGEMGAAGVAEQSTIPILGIINTTTVPTFDKTAVNTVEYGAWWYEPGGDGTGSVKDYWLFVIAY